MLSSVPFDPAEVLTTNTLDAYIDTGRPMLNNYIRYAKVGGGQHGEVYLCYKSDPKLPTNHPEYRIPVAMKSVRRDNPRAEQLKKLRQRRLPSTPHTPLADKLNTTEAKIRKEIAIMKKCRHPHVVRLYEVIDDRMRDKIYMVMEYLGGGEVKWRNDGNEPILTVEQTRRIMRDAVLGLEYLHYQGIIHRDIKPANLLWTDDRRQVKIGDFGVSHFSYAQRLAAAGNEGDKDPHDPILLDDSDLTRRAGTPSFLAPEVVFEHTNDPMSSSGSSSLHAVGSSSTVASIRPRPPITKAIDVWALGVTLYCLLFGKTPFFADPSLPSSEWSLYNSICNNDWDAEEMMAFDKIPTSGRHPSDDDSEGSLVIRLLSHLLEKDVTQRITLDEVKRSPWLLRGLPEPQKWLEVTSPTYKINVSKAETSVAMSNVRFSWNWGAVRRMFSNLRPLHHARARQNTAKRRRRLEDDGRGPVMSDPQMEQRIKFPSPRHPLPPPPPPKPVPRKQEINSLTPLVRSYERIPDSSASAVARPKNQRSKSIDRWCSTPTPRPRPTIVTSIATASTVTASVVPSSAIRVPGVRRGSESQTSASQSQGGTPSSPTGSDRPRPRFSQFISSLSHWRSGGGSKSLPTSALAIGGGGVGGKEKGGIGAGPGSGNGRSGNGTEVSTPLSSSPHPRSYPASVALPLGRKGKGQVMRRSEEALRRHPRGPFPVHQSMSAQQQQQAQPNQQSRYSQCVYGNQQYHHGQNYHNHQHPYNPLAHLGGSSSGFVGGATVVAGGGGSPFSGSGPSNASGMFTAARRASSWGYEGFDNSEYVDVVSLRSDRIELNDHEMIVGAGGVSNDLQALMPRSLSAGVGITSSGTAGGAAMVAAAASGSGVGGAGPLSSASRTIVGGRPVPRENGRVSFYDERYGPPGFDEDSSTIASGSGSVCRSSGSSASSCSGEWQRGSGMFAEEVDDGEEVVGEDEEVVGVGDLEQRECARAENGERSSRVYADEDASAKSREGQDQGDNEDDSDDDNRVTFAPKRRAVAAAT